MKGGGLLLFCFFLAGCDQLPFVEPRPVTEADYRDSDKLVDIAPNRIPALQELASNACRCEQKNGFDARDTCWSDFWTEVNEYRYSSTASACGSGSVSFLEFGEDIVMTEWGHGACSNEEVNAIATEQVNEDEFGGC